MAPRDYYARVDGYNNKQRRAAELLRLSVWASLSNWEGSITFEDWAAKYFPLAYDEKPDLTPVEISPDEIQAMLTKHAELHKK